MRLYRWQDGIAICILVLLLFLSGFRMMNPELFVFYNYEPGVYAYDDSKPPYFDCSKPLCKWENVPVSQENIYLKQTNPLLYEIYMKQGLINTILILIGLSIFFINRKRLKTFFVK